MCVVVAVSSQAQAQDKDMTSHSVPLSLGKPSLRRRLEAYYSIVAPEQLEDKGTGAAAAARWLDRFDLIYSKYGGTTAGERRLADKLSKKYGATVRLQTVVEPTDVESTVSAATAARRAARNDGPVEASASYQLPTNGTGVLDFASDLFDARAALRATPEQVQAANPIVGEASMMDRVDQCSCLLPQTDALYRPRVVRKRDERSAKDRPKERPPPFFASFAAPFEEGPMSVLHEAMALRLRVRVLIRYVDGIRGTATGFVMAFDKHFNLLLRDAEEVYSPRLPADGLSNMEMELRRRRLGMGNPEAPGQPTAAWSSRHRYLKQVLIRGDSVVLIYKADDEKSSWPPTAKSPVCLHRKRFQGPPHTHQRVGSPGSLIYARTDRVRAKQKSSYKSTR
jgi:small nuclear ribonucleoprotein (snRNP)-like protein